MAGLPSFTSRSSRPRPNDHTGASAVPLRVVACASMRTVGAVVGKAALGEVRSAYCREGTKRRLRGAAASGMRSCTLALAGMCMSAGGMGSLEPMQPVSARVVMASSPVLRKQGATCAPERIARFMQGLSVGRIENVPIRQAKPWPLHCSFAGNFL